jgi:hypothetical protein
MSTERHITWENFRDNFIEPGDPAAHIVDGQPKCEFFVDPESQRIGLRVAIKDASEVLELPYQHITTSIVHSDGGLFVEVSCSVQSLFEPFYAMIVSVTDLVQLDDSSPTSALQKSAEKTFSLLSAHALLSEEKQVGLWCELWVLNKLVTFRGVEAVQSWIGPLKEPHDFRLDNVELEIKGTRSQRRSHLISSEDQLVPSENSSLYLVSLQLALAAGEGSFGLAERVEVIANSLAGSPAMLSIFESLLSEAEYNSSHERFYRSCYKLRTRPALVPITAEIPRITAELLSDALGPDNSARLSDVKFRLDVTDLGFEEDEEPFQSTLQTR